MRTVFADTSYFIALINDLDTSHLRAVELAREVTETRSRIVTTFSVLEELLTEWSQRHVAAKLKVADFVDRLRRSPNVEILPIDEPLFAAATELYRRRIDKQYSLVDCMSMVVCAERAISEVLTADRDFQQERLRALLRERP